MTNRRIPTRIVETGRVVRGSSGQGVGWLQSLAERARGLRAQLDGIQRRLTSPMIDGVPAAVSGEVTFKANTQEQIAVYYPVQPQVIDPEDAFVSLTCNPIVKAGQTYRIPVMFPPPGVLSVQNLVVTLEAGMTQFGGVNRPRIYALNDYLQTTQYGSFSEYDKPSAPFTWQQQILGTAWQTLPFLPFFWNIIDEKSGRQYAQDWMPHGALLNTRGNNVAVRVAPDSEVFDFDTPWLFERDAQISFLFRPIMDLYQVDASSDVLPYIVDDRNQGKRNQQLTVRVEMHGIRHYDRQDVLKEGAYV
jgi:hypothetical protein